MAVNYHELVFTGDTTVDRVAKFRDKIQQAAKEHLYLLIDFTEIDELPNISGAIIGDIITKLQKSYYHIVILNSDALGNHFVQQHPETETFKYFDNYTRAEDFFNAHPVKVLVVEDNEVAAKMIEQYLENHNLVVVNVTTGEEAIEQSQLEMPHLILMDIHLPEMSGLEAAQYIRAHPETMGIPIIMLTGDAVRDNVESAVQLNVEGYVVKPFNPQTFFHKILKVLSGM
jgi:CheY-like chemotaxis protein